LPPLIFPDITDGADMLMLIPHADKVDIIDIDIVLIATLFHYTYYAFAIITLISPQAIRHWLFSPYWPLLRHYLRCLIH